MREARRLVMNRWTLTLPQFDVLAELARADAGGFTFVELSRLLLVTSGNLTGIVDRLEEQRLVERRPDAHDGRVIRVALTERGRRVTDQMLPAHAADIEEMLSFMPRNSLAALSDLLGRLRDGLRERQRREQPAPVRRQKSALRRVG
jgi:DNA-binding MarR family transcriptional regulator